MTAALSFATVCSVGTTLLPDMCPQRLGVALVLEVDGDDTRPARDSRVRMTLMVLP